MNLLWPTSYVNISMHSLWLYSRYWFGWIVSKIIKDVFTFHIISWILLRRRPNPWWSNPTCHLSCTVNTMPADALATLGARASAGMVLTCQNIPASEELRMHLKFLTQVTSPTEWSVNVTALNSIYNSMNYTFNHQGIVKATCPKIFWKLEQLECLHSDNTPTTPWLPILLIHIRSQVKTRQSQSYKFEKFAENSNFEILQKTFTWHFFWSCLKRCVNMKWIQLILWKIQSGHASVHRRMDRWKDRQTDGQHETSIPPFNFIEAGVIIISLLGPIRWLKI